MGANITKIQITKIQALCEIAAVLSAARYTARRGIHQVYAGSGNS